MGAGRVPEMHLAMLKFNSCTNCEAQLPTPAVCCSCSKTIHLGG